MQYWPGACAGRGKSGLTRRTIRSGFNSFRYTAVALYLWWRRSASSSGVMGGLRFLGQAKVVGPGGDVLARTWSTGALAVAEVDVQHEIARSRRILHHLEELTPSSYVTDRRGR